MEPAVSVQSRRWPTMERPLSHWVSGATSAADSAVPPLWSAGSTPAMATGEVAPLKSPTNLSPVTLTPTLTPSASASTSGSMTSAGLTLPRLPPLHWGRRSPAQRPSAAEARAPHPLQASSMTPGGTGRALPRPSLSLPTLCRAGGVGGTWAGIQPLSPLSSLPSTPMGVTWGVPRAPQLPPLRPVLPSIARVVEDNSTAKAGEPDGDGDGHVLGKRPRTVDFSLKHSNSTMMAEPTRRPGQPAQPLQPCGRSRGDELKSTMERPPKKSHLSLKDPPPPPLRFQRAFTRAAPDKGTASPILAPAIPRSASVGPPPTPPPPKAGSSPAPLNPFPPELAAAAQDAEMNVHSCALAASWRLFSGLPLSRETRDDAAGQSAATAETAKAMAPQAPMDGGDVGFPPNEEVDLMHLADSLTTVLPGERATILSAAAQQLGAIRAAYAAYCGAAALEELSQRAYRFVPPAEVAGRRRWITARFAAARQRVLGKYAAYARVGRFFLGNAAALPSTSGLSGAGASSTGGAAPGAAGRKARPKGGVRRGGLDARVAGRLKCWLLDHIEHPYASREEKQVLSALTGLTVLQISNYLINARVRVVSPLTADLMGSTGTTDEEGDNSDADQETAGDSTDEEKSPGRSARRDPRRLDGTRRGSTGHDSRGVAGSSAVASLARRSRRSAAVCASSSMSGPDARFVDEHSRLLLRLFISSLASARPCLTPQSRGAAATLPSAGWTLGTTHSSCS